VTHRRNPIGSKRRWREGHAHRVEDRAAESREHCLQTGIGHKLDVRLRAYDIGTDELAEALGVGRSAVMAWVAGRQMPSLKRLVTIALALKCSLVDLLPDEAHLP